MDDKVLAEEKKNLARLILQAEKTLERMERVHDTSVVKKSAMDSMANFAGLRTKTDGLVKKSSDLSHSRILSLYQGLIEDAGEYINVDSIVTSNIYFDLKFNKSKMLNNFSNDLSVRLATADINSCIKDVKRIRNSLILRLRRLERREKSLEIEEKFSKIKKTINDL